ncbi:MFS transporter [Nocardioides rubriscoriae]|uniref:MFS transporter n=1 Tax=Nocardioides rubriscoriae TaxID=642762 RepID=UPI001B887375|nr:MFS transporter [Nocardioides rubriscoriae]
MTQDLVDAQPRVRDPKWWTLVAVCTGVFMLLLDVTIVNVALFDIQADLDASLPDVQWVIDAYALSLAALLLTAGSLADLFGRKRVFVIGLVLFTTGSVLCGAAPDVLFLSVARGAQGIGGAAMFATALALLASAFTGKDRGTAFAVFGATTGVSVAVGPVLGGLLTTGLSWRWIFFVNIPICAVALLVTVFRVQESHDPRAGRPDWVGFVTFSAALGSLVYGLIEAGQHSWGETKVVVCLVAAAVLLALFVVSQLRRDDPMFDLALLRKPTFTGGLVAAFGISAGVFALFTFLVLYLQGVLGFDAIGAGLVFLCLSGTSFVAAIVAGRLTELVPVKWLIAPGFVVAGVGLLLMLGVEHSTDQSQWHHLVPGLLVAGFGVGMINPPLASTAVGVVPPARSGMASGANSTFRQVGIATGIAALGSILAQQVTADVERGLSGVVPPQAVGPLAEALSSGQVRAAAAVASDQATQAGGAQAGRAASEAVTQVGTAAYVDALNTVLLIGAVLCLVCAVLGVVLIRQRDFDSAGRYRTADADADAPPRHVDPEAAEAPLGERAPTGGAHAASADAGATGASSA